MKGTRLIASIPNVNHEGSLGCAKVYEDKTEATLALETWHKKGVLVCCGGYYNAVWLKYED